MRALILCGLGLLFGCATVAPSRALVTVPEHQKLGLKPDAIEPWEDGRRTDGAPGSYEWWYFDAHLDDGSTLVIVFFDKPIDGAGGPMDPVVSVQLDRPDGTKFSTGAHVDVQSFSAAKDACDVRLGPNRFQGDLKRYTIHLDLPEAKGDLELVSEVAPWRPGAGVITFGEHDEKYFAWLPSVPHGQVRGTLTLGDKTMQVSGTGYHDHNWGNAALPGLIHDWYWGRAHVGDYTIIASYITAEDRFSGTHFPILLVTKKGAVLVGNSAHVTFKKEREGIDELTHKPVSARLEWTFEHEGKRVRVTFERQRSLLHFPLTQQLPRLARFAAGVIGFDGAYHRFGGDVTVEVFDGETRVDSQRNSAAVWELMYLGHALPPSR